MVGFSMLIPNDTRVHEVQATLVGSCWVNITTGDVIRVAYECEIIARPSGSKKPTRTPAIAYQRPLDSTVCVEQRDSFLKNHHAQQKE